MADKKDFLIKQQNLLNFNNSNDGTIIFSKYDEPTYLTFRINFMPNNVFTNLYKINDYITLSNNNLKTTSYDDIPEPLFANVSNANEKIYYSTYDYLLNSLGDERRASLLNKFIKLVYDLNWNFPFYIKSIDGISELLEVDPKRGSRIKKDATITLKCYEGLDQRISTLKTLYKKIVWDDTFQRWILPDMMRFFRMNIYISEFRIFHEYKGEKTNDYNFTSLNNFDKTGSKLNVVNTIKDSINTMSKLFNSVDGVTQNAWQLINHSINSKIPTIKIECRMCEFDISDMFSHLSSLDSNNPKQKMLDDLDIKIKIGNISEIYYNEMLNNEKILIDDYILSLYSNKSEIVTNKKIDKKIEDFEDNSFKERIGLNEIVLDETQMFNDNVTSRSMSYLGETIRNTLKGAIAYGDNLADKELNKLMMKIIGESGLSFNDILSATTSASITSMYNTFKVKAEAIKENYPEVSQATKEDLSLQTFKNFVDSVANSSNQEQAKIANILLEYGDSENFTSIDEYLNVLKEINNEIQTNIENKIIFNKEINEEITSLATNENNKIKAKIIL